MSEREELEIYESTTARSNRIQIKIAGTFNKDGKRRYSKNTL